MFYRFLMWFLAFFRLNDYAICKMSRGKGMRNDYHDYPDDNQGPAHFVTLKCRRCGKEFLIALLLALFLLPAVSLAQTVSISGVCPAMPVNRLSFFPPVWQCAKEVGTASAILPDGTKLIFSDFEIQPTTVTKKKGKRTVSACTQYGFSQNMDQLSAYLPEETVTAGGAQPMQAPFVLTMHDGAVYTGFITYPVSHIQWVGPGRCIASQVLMTGTGTLKK